MVPATAMVTDPVAEADGYVPISWRSGSGGEAGGLQKDNVLSVKTHRRAATGNTRSREASGTAGGPRSLGQRPKSPAHALAW
jgi:hypothetical protein